jgi:hypothetical protein
MEMALTAGKPEAAQLVAAECLVEAETKDHLNWELLSKVSERLKGEESQILKAAVEQVEEDTSIIVPDGLENSGLHL